MCGSAAYKTHVKNLILFAHAHPSMSVATGNFSSSPDGADTTRLETELSFLQVRNSMQLAQKLRQVGAEICANRREIAQTRLESIAATANPYSLISTFGHGHLVTKAGAAAYVTKCAPVDVTPRHTENCTAEIPVFWGEKEVFVDPISFVIKPMGTLTRCNDIAPVRYCIADRWYCATPVLRECTPPKSLPVEPVRIDETNVASQGLGRSIYSSKQLAEFAAFQDSQGTRQAYLAETAELAFSHMNGHGSFGLGLNEYATGQIVDLIGLAFVPLYFIFGPPAITIVFIIFTIGMAKLLLTITIRAVSILKTRGCGLWVFAAFYGTLFQLAMVPVRWAGKVAEDVGDRVGDGMELEAKKRKQATHTYPLLEDGQEEGRQVKLTSTGARYFWHTKTGDEAARAEHLV